MPHPGSTNGNSSAGRVGTLATIPRRPQIFPAFVCWGPADDGSYLARATRSSSSPRLMTFAGHSEIRWARKVMPVTLQELMRHESIETTLKFYVASNADLTVQAVWDSCGASSHGASGSSESGELPLRGRRFGGRLVTLSVTVARKRKEPPLPIRCKCGSFIDLRKLPGKGSNLERGNQNPLCYHYTTG